MSVIKLPMYVKSSVLVIVPNMSFPMAKPDLKRLLLVIESVVLYISYMEEDIEIDTSIIAPIRPSKISHINTLAKFN